MEYLDIYNIKPVDSGPISLMNYMNDLKHKEKISKIKEKFEITREFHSIEFAKKMQDYKLKCDIKNVVYSELKHNEFPFIACCKNQKREEIFFLVYNITDDGIITKDHNYEEKLISIIDFKEIFNDRIIVFLDNKEFISKYSYSKERLITDIAGGISVISFAILDAIFEILSDVTDEHSSSLENSNKKLYTIFVFTILIICGILFLTYLVFRLIYSYKQRKLDIKILELEIENTGFNYDTRRKNK